MNIWTLRHPPIDRQGLCIGQTHCPCTMPPEDSMLQASGNAPFVPVQIISSDLLRCSRLAEDLADFWKCTVKLSPQLREMNFGDWDGLSYDEIDETDHVRWRAWCSNWLTEAPPGGESIDQFSARIARFLTAERPCEHTVLVTHAGVIRVLQVMAGESWDVAMSTNYPFLSWNYHAVKLILG